MCTMPSPSNSSYAIKSTSECHVVADSKGISSRIWFSTPALDEGLINSIEKIKLETKSHVQGFNSPDLGSWSWFEIVILESPKESQPRVKDGRSLVWYTHENKFDQYASKYQAGELSFDGQQEIFSSLEVGNSIAVRVCAQYLGWDNFAVEGRLVLQLCHGDRAPPCDKSNIRHRDERWPSEVGHDDEHHEAPPRYSLRSHSMNECQPLQLLSLDGGGVRGISTLRILGGLMDKISNGDPTARPCDYFHMIAGTSTGGLIAIMLGRLKMTVQQCVDAYEKLAAEIFSATPSERMMNVMHTRHAKHSAERFEAAVKRIIKQHTGDENSLMMEPNCLANQCKVFVTAVRFRHLHREVILLRSFSPRQPSRYSTRFSDIKIWQAARSTSAAPTILPEIKVAGAHLFDGGLKVNNPAMLLLDEVEAVFGRARPIGCFLTIGTGKAPALRKMTALRPVSRFIESAIAEMTDCEEVHHDAKQRFEAGTDTYWRFNIEVVDGDDWVGIDDYRGMKKLDEITQNYMEEEANRALKCASRLTKLWTSTPKTMPRDGPHRC